MNIVPFEPSHLGLLDLQDAQKMHAEAFDDIAAYGKRLQMGTAFTGFMDGHVLACAGILDKWPGVGIGWFLFSENVGAQHFLKIHKTVVRMVDIWLERRLHRIECSVHPDHPEGERWMGLLGFTFEGIAHRYGPDGQDYHIYAKWREQ